MRMLRPIVYKKILELLPAQTVFGQHTFDGFFDDQGSGLGFQLPGSREPLAAGITGVPDIFLVIPLFARQPDFVGVDHDDLVAAIYMRTVAGLVLALDQSGYATGKTAQDLGTGVDQQPFLLNTFLIGMRGFVTIGIHNSRI